MCGICGIVYTHSEEQPSVERLNRMCGLIVHRGPDDRGIGVFRQAGLGMQRLSIIDLAGGHQPISNENGTIWIVFNGEIYNFPEIRDELLAKGHQFKTRSDTETIVHAYEEWGDESIAKLNGMFALAVWDMPKRRLLLARDRVGKKPLFYAWSPQRLIFASEIKALLQETVRPEVNPQAIWHYLSLQYVPGPETILRGIYKLPAGHYLVWEAGQISVHRYWEIDYRNQLNLTTAEWVERVRHEITEAVRRRLISDVPLGAFLSGGVDSSIVVALMAQLSDEPVRTFSIGFDEERFDETQYAWNVARQYRTEHHEFTVRFDHVADTLPTLVWHLDEPLADPSALAVYHLAKLARQYVTVALNGDGGDEAFAGYTRYVLDRALNLYRRFPDAVKYRLVPWIAGQLPARPDIPVEKNAVTALHRLEQACRTNPGASIMAWGSYFSDAMKPDLCTEDLLQEAGWLHTEDLLSQTYEQARAKTYLDRTLYTDLKLYLTDDLLVKADRMTMAASLEARSPFLDYRVLELMAAAPEHLKIRKLSQKWLLRRAFEQLVPKENVRRIKQGFGIPLGAWFRGQLRDVAYDILLSTVAVERGYFRRESVARLLDEHVAGAVDHGYRIWALLLLEMWHREFVDRAWPYVPLPLEVHLSLPS